MAKGGIAVHATPRLYSPADSIILTVWLQFAIACFAWRIDPQNLPFPEGSGTPSNTTCHWIPQVTEMGRRHLRSTDVYPCAVPRTQSQISGGSFTAAGPRLWNNLPIEIRQQNITFKHYMDRCVGTGGIACAAKAIPANNKLELFTFKIVE